MPNAIVIISAFGLVLHGLVHLIGTATYMKIVKVEGFSYKTTLLGGRWDLGESGIRIFGVLWVVPALGFILAAVAMVFGWWWWQPFLISVTLFSLLLTVLNWRDAYAGIIIDLVILAVLALEPYIDS